MASNITHYNVIVGSTVPARCLKRHKNLSETRISRLLLLGGGGSAGGGVGLLWVAAALVF
ncbi:unnamed protein product [Prunus armeniaca]